MAGILQRAEDNALDKKFVPSNGETKIPLTLKHLQAGFYLLVIGLIISGSPIYYVIIRYHSSFMFKLTYCQFLIVIAFVVEVYTRLPKKIEPDEMKTEEANEENLGIALQRLDTIEEVEQEESENESESEEK